MIPFGIPPTFLAFSDRDETWAAWLEALPRLVRDIVDEWELTCMSISRCRRCRVTARSGSSGRTRIGT